MGQGWEDWNIAAFAAYLACFTRLAVKSSHAAHLSMPCRKRTFPGTASVIS